MDALRINYTPTERSVRAALLAGYNWLTFGLCLALGGAVLTAGPEIASVNWSSMRSVLFWIISVGLGLCGGLTMAIAARYLLIPLSARSIFRKNPVLFGPSTLIADGEGVTLTTPNTSAKFGWNDLRGYKEMKGAVVFAPKGSAYYAVPTSEIAEGDLQALRQILRDRVPLLNR